MPGFEVGRDLGRVVAFLVSTAVAYALMPLWLLIGFFCWLLEPIFVFIGPEGGWFRY